MTKFSILDLVPVVEGSTPAKALRNSLHIAQSAERWGYERYWLAEHHNMRGIASSATSVIVGYIAGGTSSIRVGAGGVMLPNHSPLVIAEQFGTLASLYPGRIDLGVGRAPGTDQETSHALRRTLSGSVDDFPRDVVELQHYLKEPKPGQRVTAVPGAGTDIPLWILGSSLFGAQLAARLGLPFVFASHFAPGDLVRAIEIYRERFEPSAQLQVPYVMLGFNLCAANTDQEALYLRSSSLQSFLNLRYGRPGLLPPPIQNFDQSLNHQERAVVSQLSTCSAVGNIDTVKKRMADFIELTKADELMLVCSVFDHQKRLDSFELAAEAAKYIQNKARS